MSTISTESRSLQTVAGFSSSPNGGMNVRFDDGLTVLLPQDFPRYELARLQFEESQKHRIPVGLVLDAAGGLVDVNHAHDVQIAELRDDDEDENRLLVCCWGFSPVCYLTRDHPDFGRIRATLETALRTKEPVWLANESQMVESETELWWKILDVRLVHVEINGR